MGKYAFLILTSYYNLYQEIFGVSMMFQTEMCFCEYFDNCHGVALLDFSVILIWFSQPCFNFYLRKEHYGIFKDFLRYFQVQNKK